MDGWIKSFTDGTNEIGFDRSVNRKLASWSRGRLSNICSVRLDHGVFTLEISGFGNYWQSDTYEAVFGGQPIIIKRRIEKQITEQDKNFVHFKYLKDHLHLIVFNYEDSEAIQIDNSLIGKWLIFEFNLKDKSINYYFSNNRI